MVAAFSYGYNRQYIEELNCYAINSPVINIVGTNRLEIFSFSYPAMERIVKHPFVENVMRKGQH